MARAGTGAPVPQMPSPNERSDTLSEAGEGLESGEAQMVVPMRELIIRWPSSFYKTEAWSLAESIGQNIGRCSKIWPI